MNINKCYRYSQEIISHAIWLYHRFTLSFREIKEMLACRGIVVTYETIRQWCLKLTSSFVKSLRKKHGVLGGQWSLDEVLININGKRHYLWCAVDQNSCELGISLTKRRDKKSAVKFFKKLFKRQSQQPRKITTDKFVSYKASLYDLGCKKSHITNQCENNIAESLHQKTRQQQRQMRQLVSISQAQQFIYCHGIINNHFRQQRHLLKAKYYRFFRDRTFVQSTQVTCVQNMGIG